MIKPESPVGQRLDELRGSRSSPVVERFGDAGGDVRRLPAVRSRSGKGTSQACPARTERATCPVCRRGLLGAVSVGRRRLGTWAATFRVEAGAQQVE